MTKIKQTAKVGLLTNMYPHLLTTIINANLLPPVNWDKIIDSSVVGFEKPGVEIYKLAEIQAEVSSNQILFVDNTPKNLDIPQSLGWQTFLYDSTDYETSTRQLELFLQNIVGQQL